MGERYTSVFMDSHQSKLGVRDENCVRRLMERRFSQISL